MAVDGVDVTFTHKIILSVYWKLTFVMAVDGVDVTFTHNIILSVYWKLTFLIVANILWTTGNA